MLGSSSQSIGPYRFIRHIGSGAFAEVYLVERENRQYALKVIEIALGKDPQLIDHEVRINAELKNIQGVCQICDYFRDENNYYMVFEYCQKGDLKKYNQVRKKMTEVVAKPIIQNILKAVESIHLKNICHRDIKPDNIFMTSSNKIKFGDFGLATVFSEENGCLVRGSVGSPQYASPECVSLKYYNGKATDVWSLGVVFYEMLVGKIPWKSTNKEDLFNEIRNDNVTFSEEFELSDSCVDFLRRFLTVDVKKRFTIDEALNHPFLAVKISSRMSMDFTQIQMSFKLEPPTYLERKNLGNNNENLPSTTNEKNNDNFLNTHHHNQNSLYMSDNMNITNNINFANNNELDFKNFEISNSCNDCVSNNNSIIDSAKSIDNNSDNTNACNNSNSSIASNVSNVSNSNVSIVSNNSTNSENSENSTNANNKYETDTEINYNILHAEMNKSRKKPRRCSNFNDEKVFSKQFNFKLDLNFVKDLNNTCDNNNSSENNSDNNDTNESNDKNNSNNSSNSSSDANNNTRKTKDRSNSARITGDWRNKLFVNKNHISPKKEGEINSAEDNDDVSEKSEKDEELEAKRRINPMRINRQGSVGNFVTNSGMGSIRDSLKSVGGVQMSPRNNASLDNQVNNIMEKIKKMRRA